MEIELVEIKIMPPSDISRRGARLSKNPPGFSDKRLAVCCAHNLSVCDGQIPHWQPELYFLSRTCRERK